MEKFWRGVGLYLGKFWYVVLLAVVAITALLYLGLRNIEFATGQDSYLNPDSQIAIDNEYYQDLFGGETVLLLFTAEEGSTIADLYEGENLATLERITAELGEGVDNVHAVITPLVSLGYSAEILSGGAGSSALISAASSDPDADGTAARNADVSLALARLGAVSPDDRRVGVPEFNELLLFSNEGYEVVDGSVVSPPIDERAIRLSLLASFPNLETAVGGVVLKGNATLDEQSEATVQVLEILEGAQFDGFDLVVTGSPVYLKEINDYLQGGMLTLGAIALAVMVAVLALIFRVRWRLLPILSVIIGVIWAFSFMGLLGINLSLVTISGLPILIGLGIDFAIQLHNRVEEEVVLDRDPHPISESVANLGPPLVAAVITAVVAFLALRISLVPMIRDFGVLLSIGVVMLLITGIVVTVSALGAREYHLPTKERGRSLVERIVVALGSVPQKAAVPMIIAAVVLFVGGVLAEGRMKIQSDPLRWIDQGSQVVADVDRLEEATGFGTTLGVLVESNNILDQDMVDLLWDFTLAAEERDLVVSSSSIVNTMGKVIKIPGATPIPPTVDDVVAAVAAMSDDVSLALLGMPAGESAAVLESSDDSAAFTTTQINLRIAPSSLEERAVLVRELEADLDGRIAEMDLAADSILLRDLPADQAPARAVPAGLATVGIGLLENLSSNRAALTYLSLSLAGLWLVIRHRSLARALIALVPVFLAVGASSLIIGLSGIELSPLTTVSGPLVIATCSEFSVLILGRFLEERQRGLSAREGCDRAAARTGRAFFTSAITTIGGFAVLIGSALPLLRDFGIVVTLNVAIALLAALVVMPPLMVWADERGLLGTEKQISQRSVRLAAPIGGQQSAVAALGLGAFAAGAVVTYGVAETADGEAVETQFIPAAFTTTTTTTTIPEIDDTDDADGPSIDPSSFGDARPDSLVGGILFDGLIEQGVAPNVANCAIETTFSRVPEADLLALGLIEFTDEALAPIIAAARDCGIDDATIAATIESVSGGAATLPDTADGGADDAGDAGGTSIDPSSFGDDRPDSLVGGILFDGLTGEGVAPNVANCAIETTFSRVSEADLLALGLVEFTDEALAPIIEAAQECGIDDDTIDATIASVSGR